LRAAIIRAIFLAPFVILAQPLAALAAGADGHWRVDLQTTVGAEKCPAAGSVTIEVKNRRLTGIEPSSITPWGYIDETNTFVGHFNSGDKVVRANGEVKGGAAAGPWSSQSDFCGGRWTARKID
jgi:hypothetical protein